MPKVRTSAFLLAIGLLVELASARATRGQQPVAGTPDNRLFPCRDDDLRRPGSTGFGCQRLLASHLPAISDAPLFWHLRKVPAGTRTGAGDSTAFIVDAPGQSWLYSFGPKDAVPTEGEPAISIGPLPLRPAKAYQVVAYYVVMPAGAYTIIHTHPGPEAWYVLEGTQCLDTPKGAMKLGAGEGGVVPPDTPMRLHNSGSTLRRALFIVIHDPALAWGSRTDWTPTGGCGK